MFFVRIFGIIGLLTVSACAEVASNTVAGCGGSAAKSNLEGILEKTVAKIVPQVFARDGFVGSISTMEIRRAARTLALTIDNARTSDDQPNSTARSCKATVKVKLPEATMSSVESLLGLRGGEDIDSLAAQFDGEQRGQSVDFDLTYDVQPTDDASKVIVEAAPDQGLFRFAAAFIALQLRSPEASAQIATAQRTEAEEQTTIAQSEQEVALATQQSELAAVEEARTESRLARQTINAVWTGLEPPQRQSILELQRAWLKRKQADCNLESASSSTDPELKSISYLKCDTRMTQERIQWLRTNAVIRDSRSVAEEGPWIADAMKSE